MTGMTRKEFSAALFGVGAISALGSGKGDFKVAQRPSPFEPSKMLSYIGFGGGKRFPEKDGGKLSQYATFDYDTAARGIEYALEHGVNFFDSASAYHLRGDSERFYGKVLSKYPRNSYTFCTKMSPWSIKTLQDGKDLFAEQLDRCQMDSFDVYMLHTVLREEDFERTFVRTGILDFLREQREIGRIKRLGFSFHGRPDFLRKLLDMGFWEAVMLLINGKDWDSANRSRELLSMVREKNIPVFGMESLCGGCLAHMKPEAHKILQDAEPNSTDASWSLRFAASAPGVVCALTSFTKLEHLYENVATFDSRTFHPMTESERSIYLKAIEVELGGMKGVPCSECAYCMPCPYGVDIPGVFHAWNMRLRVKGLPGPSSHAETRSFLKDYRARVPALRDASRCIGCGDCEKRCPQWQFVIPDELAKIDAYMSAAQRREFDLPLN